MTEPETWLHVLRISSTKEGTTIAKGDKCIDGIESICLNCPELEMKLNRGSDSIL